MRALVYEGSEDVRVEQKPDPTIEGPQDAVIRVTTTTICGSDLHLYHHQIAGLKKGDILGHEFMGMVEQVGPEVKSLQPGDRVVVAGTISCGTCWFCQHGMFSLCDTTNQESPMHLMYGQNTAGIFGYTHLMGGYCGGQADKVRVPFADVGCLKVPESLSDEKVLFLSDILCTGWHGATQAEVDEGKTVAVWGCGPVGLMTMLAARIKGAARIIAIDHIPYRLEAAREHLGAETINFDETEPVGALLDMTNGRGPDCAIEVVGFRYATSMLHKVERALHLETDTSEIVSQVIRAVRKGGNVAIVGDYIGFANHFPIGALMEKGLTVRTGQVFVQKYWKDLLSRIERGEIDTSFVISHRMSLDQAAEGYKLFDEKRDNVLKVLLTTAQA